MATYRKRFVGNEVRWDVTVTKVGAPRQTRTFPTKSLGQIWAREEERDIARGAWKSTAPARRTTVQMLFDDYIEEELPKKKSQVAVKSAARAVCRELGNVPVIALTPELLVKYRDERLQREAQGGGPLGRPLGRLISPDSVRKELQILKRVIQYALSEHKLHLPLGNPVALIKLPPAGKPRDRRLRDLVPGTKKSELQLLIDGALEAGNPRLALLTELAVETAMRRSENCTLAWTDIDYARRTALLRDTKNGEGRPVPLSMRAIEILKSLPRNDGEPYVVMLKPGSLTRSFRRLVHRLGLPNLRRHDLRHEAASRAAEKLKGNLVALKHFTGHKDVKSLMRYVHPDTEKAARLLD